MGPWVHGADATARSKSGELDFGPDAAIDYDDVVLDWMDRYVRQDDSAPLLEPVRYFVMGANRWKFARSWPPEGREQVLYLAAGTSSRGTLVRSEPAAESSSSAFLSNPADPVVNPYDSAGAHDYQKLAERKDVLTFDSPPLDRDLEAAGPIRGRLFVSCDCRDTDLWMRVLDVTPDGRAYNLMSPGLDAIRASYRDLSSGRRLLDPGTIVEIRLDHLVTANVFRQGHRIRVQVSSTFFPNFSRNLHTGELETTSSRMQTATIRLHHDRTHPSRISLHVANQ
jgi:putative CocE/NonD family hydrolase